MPQIKKAQQIRNPGSEAGFRHAEKEATGHLRGPGLRRGLEARDEAPDQDDAGAPDVRREDFPKQVERLEDDVGDVEDVQEPLVAVAGEGEGFGHAGDFGVAFGGEARLARVC